MIGGEARRERAEHRRDADRIDGDKQQQQTVHTDFEQPVHPGNRIRHGNTRDNADGVMRLAEQRPSSARC